MKTFRMHSIHLKPVRTEAQENVVMRFGEQFNSHRVEVMSPDSTPFEIDRYANEANGSRCFCTTRMLHRFTWK